tara:strand:- start:91 stop:642 length:552 start_codon:yes stop_codon:yes gene_type:complete
MFSKFKSKPVLPGLLVMGHGRHGKDTVCEILRDEFDYSFKSSSKFCSELFIFDKLKDKYGYDNEDECYADRHDHRAEWYDAICDYNVPDAARLGRDIFEKHGIYCGLRSKREFFAMKNTRVFDYSIWVDRSEHLPLEPKTSMSVEQWMSDFTIDNNGSIEDLKFNVRQFINAKTGPRKSVIWI